MREGLHKINRPLTIAGSDHSLTFEITTNQNKTMANLQTSDEVFMPIFGYPGYEISNLGRVKSLRKTVLKGNGKMHYTRPERILKIQITWQGYCKVSLYRDGKGAKYSVHRLAAIHFVPNPFLDLYDQINHKDGNKKNNAVSNLEWCTGSQNSLHKYRELGFVIQTTGRYNVAPHMRSVIQLTQSGQEIKKYISAADAARNGFNASHISDCCKGGRQTHKGFKWKYYEIN